MTMTLRATRTRFSRSAFASDHAPPYAHPSLRSGWGPIGAHFRLASISGLRLAQVLVLAICASLAAPPALFASVPRSSYSPLEAEQAADILGIKPQFDRLLALQKGDSEASQNEQLSLRALILRKLLLGFVQVRQASNKTDIELTYAYDRLYHEQQVLGTVLDAMNLFNFTQFAVLYTIAPYSRINKQFTQSSVLGLNQAGIGTVIPIASILFQKYFSFKKETPPAILKNSLAGAPVDGYNMPPLITKFLDTPDLGKSDSRRQEMYDSWKKNNGADPADKSTLAGLNDNKRATLGLLSKRIVLLWDLRNQIQAFDHELMALSNIVKASTSSHSNKNVQLAELNPAAAEACHLLNMEGDVAGLIDLNKHSSSSRRRLELDTLVLERILNGTIDVRIATDKVDQELHFNYDIALAALQKNFDMNFLQTGTLVMVAKYLFLKGYPKAANEVLIVSNSLEIFLSSLAVYKGQGGHRPLAAEANSLAEFLGLDPAQFRFSPLMTEFLNQPNTEANDGKSRKDFLLALWKREHLSRLNLNSKKCQSLLAAMPGEKSDSISTIVSRLSLLLSLQANLEFFDEDLLELLKQTSPNSDYLDSGSIDTATPDSDAETAHLIGITKPLRGIVRAGDNRPVDENTLSNELMLVRKSMQAMLDVRVTADKLDLEVVRENEMRDRMVRARNLGIATTNNADFFQLGVLGAIGSGNPALSGQRRYNYYSRVINVVSGYLVGGFTGAAFLQRDGGYRPKKVEPNMLSGLFGLQTAENLQFSPMVWSYLNSAPAGVESRRVQILNYWRAKHMIGQGQGTEVKKSTAEKLAAEGPSHHWWNERIKLIDRRLRMLYLIRSTVEGFDVDLAHLLESMDGQSP